MNAPVLAQAGGRRLVVVRHGVTDHNARGVWQGHLDSELSPAGLEQARAAAGHLAGYEPDLVVCSDLRRAAQTAECVVAHLPGRVVRPDERLREIHCGDWQGLPTAEMIERFPEAQALLAGGADFRRGLTGETYAELGDRVAAAVADLLTDLAEGATALVVTHGVVARVLVGDLVRLDRPASWLTFGTLGNCHWAELTEAPDRWRLQGWNLSGRPRPPGPTGVPPAAARFGTPERAG